MLQRNPRKALQPFVRSLWVNARSQMLPGDQEVTLPSGNVCLVIRLDGTSLALVDDTGLSQPVGQAVIEGIQARPVVKVLNCTSVVGAVLAPGSLPSLTRASATEFTNDHIPLEQVIGAQTTHSLVARLCETKSLEARLCILEDFLLSLVSSTPQPMVLQTLSKLTLDTRISDLVAASGMSHRHFNHLFTMSVGVSPKYYQRLLKIRTGLMMLHREKPVALSDVALSTGYTDQPHFNREFKSLTGMTPSAYTGSLRRAPLHLPR